MANSGHFILCSYQESVLPALTKDKERIHEEIAVSVDALYHYLQGRDGRRTDARDVQQGALSRFTKFVF